MRRCQSVRVLLVSEGYVSKTTGPGISDDTRTDPAAELMQMMEQVRLEIRQNTSTDVNESDPSSSSKTTLRDELYLDDFRARARL